MNKTMKLIRWQRITIAVLLLGIGLSMYTARFQYHLADRARCELRAGTMNINRAVEAMATERNETDLRQQHDQQIITDLDERLKKYESRYGEIFPVRRGEGAYITNPKDDVPFPYYFPTPIQLVPRPMSQHPSGSADFTIEIR